MIILAIETSCDETAISLVKFDNQNYQILSNLVLSQVKLHKNYGGVYPSLAKREHSKNIFPIFKKALKESNLIKKRKTKINLSENLKNKLKKTLERDLDNYEKLIKFFSSFEIDKIDKIAYTEKPGLAPCLYIGINFALALGLILKIKTLPINHMSGHIDSALILKNKIIKSQDPTLALLISGGHTQLIKINNKKEVLIGETLDDAIGEAFDKVGRILNIPYPAGAKISILANKSRARIKKKYNINLPRPMINSNNLDFSFSGLKTAVLYLIKSQERITPKFQEELAEEFENACLDVLMKKTKKAILKYEIKSLILGGGVSANTHFRENFKNLEKEYKNLIVHLPNQEYTGDNAFMIALRGYSTY